MVFEGWLSFVSSLSSVSHWLLDRLSFSWATGKATAMIVVRPWEPRSSLRVIFLDASTGVIVQWRRSTSDTVIRVTHLSHDDVQVSGHQVLAASLRT